jgi:tetratricopeptide (TPR) repeat protein
MTSSSETADRDCDDIFDAIERGDRKCAIDLSVAALQRGVEHPVVLLLVAERLDEDGRSHEALGLLKKATVIAPDEAEVWRRFGCMLARQGMLSEALEALSTALAIDPNSYPTLAVAGATSYRLGNLAAAYDYYTRAAGLEPNEAELLSALAVIAARRKDPKEARVLAERALVLRPDSVNAQLAIARADILEGQADLAEALIARLLDRQDLNDENRIAAFDLRAETLDMLGRPAVAFADYQARNKILERVNAPMVKRMLKERRVDQASRLVAYFSTTPAEPWRAGAGEDTQGAHTVRRHIFLLGFPRSGTTLLEKVLASHPGVVTLEEVDCLTEVSERLLDSENALNELSTLTTTAADTYRQTYWHGVRHAFGKDISDKILVDKMPLYTAALPVIAKLFPSAKILFALRDPRDVILSCFRRRFKINSAMYEFLTLDGAAQYYDRVMTLAEIYRTLLSLDIHEVRHEAMVADFEAEARNALAFIGADWDPAVKGFTERASAVPRTPTDLQLARGLNSDGVGQWRRYEEQLKSVSKILDPWVGHFSYSAPRQ